MLFWFLFLFPSGALAAFQNCAVLLTGLCLLQELALDVPVVGVASARVTSECCRTWQCTVCFKMDGEGWFSMDRIEGQYLSFQKYTKKNNLKIFVGSPRLSFLSHLLPLEPAGSQVIVSSNWKLSPLLLKSFHKTLSYFIKTLNEFSRY